MSRGLTFMDEPNPFEIPSDVDMMLKRDKELQNIKDFQKKLKDKSLVQRDVTMKSSSIYSAGKQLTKNFKSVSDSTSNLDIAPPVAEHQRRENMSEFIDQKREIFLAQLLIDRKVKEIERISNMKKAEKQNIEEEEAKIAETLNQYKMTGNQIDAELTRGKKAMDDAIKRKAELSKELKKRRASVAIIKSEISKNEDLLESFKSYYDFLKKLSPLDDVEPTEYFKEPSQLLGEMEKVEYENLFLVKQCEEMYNDTENSLRAIGFEIDKTVGEKDAITARTNSIPAVEGFDYLPTNKQDTEYVESELTRLSNLVKKVYLACFKQNADLNTLTMLERIENGLEGMYSTCNGINSTFLYERQSLRDKKRREDQRVAANLKKLEEQRRKAEAALERAKRPIKRKMGRPLRERCLPIKSRRPVDDKAKQEEERAIEELLFGEIIY